MWIPSSPLLVISKHIIQRSAATPTALLASSINIDQSRNGIPLDRPKITTVIFDVDDTLYDVGTGFTTHRNTDGVTSFMVDKLYFPSKEDAQILRNKYFEKYHTTAMGLIAAEADGELPPLPEGVALPPGRTRRFDAGDLDEHWATNLDFSMLGGPDPRCVETFELLSSDPRRDLNLVAFSNAPRKYVSRALEEIGLAPFFAPEDIFSVTDVLPLRKPDRGSFDMVLRSIGARAEECVMVEDSMKNLRAAKALGMRTILVVGRGRMNGTSKNGEAARPVDAPDETDPAVDAAVEVASEIGDVLNTWLGAQTD